MITPTSLYHRLLAYETNGSNEPDARRVISAERQSLYLALQSGNAARIEATATEAERVARMWGVL